MRIRKLLLAYQLAHVQETRLRSYKRLMRAKPAIPMHVYFHLICLGTVWVRRYKSCRAPGFRAVWQSTEQSRDQVMQRDDALQGAKLYFWDAQLWGP
ncbi:hypothetical protein ABBQ38_007031 [Trebouxia sp. C0009 RCD-2024]